MKSTTLWSAAIIAAILQIIIIIWVTEDLIWDSFLPFLCWGFAFVSIYLITKSHYKDSLWLSPLVAWVILTLLFWLIPSWAVLLITLPTAVWLGWRYGILPELGIKHKSIPEPPPLKPVLSATADKKEPEVKLLPNTEPGKQVQTTLVGNTGYSQCYACNAVKMTKTHCLACNADAKPISQPTVETHHDASQAKNPGYATCHACNAVKMTKTHCLACNADAKKTPKKGVKKKVETFLDH